MDLLRDGVLPVIFMAVVGRALLPTTGLVVAIAAMLVASLLGFRMPPLLRRAFSIREVAFCVITICVMLQFREAVSFVSALLIGGFLGFCTWVKMDAEVGPYLRRRYISTVNGGSIRGVEAHEFLWAVYVSPFFMLWSGLFFALGGWWGWLQANTAAVILTIAFHVVCYMGTDDHPDERNLGAWGRPLPPRQPRTRRSAARGTRHVSARAARVKSVENWWMRRAWRAWRAQTARAVE
jgi:hypothetical protein